MNSRLNNQVTVPKIFALIFLIILTAGCSAVTRDQAGSSDPMNQTLSNEMVNIDSIVAEYHKNNYCLETDQTCRPSKRSIASVNKTINSHIGELSRFYLKRAIRQPGLYGKIVLQLKINAMGHVTQAEMFSSSLRNNSLTVL